MNLTWQVADERWASRLASFDLENFGVDAWPEPVWREGLAHSGATYVVVSEKPSALQSVGPLLAVGGVSHGPDAEILTIAVAARARRQGIGSVLLERLVEIAREHEAENIFLEVRASDRGPQRLYERAGFVAVGRRKNYYSDDDALVMHLPL